MKFMFSLFIAGVISAASLSSAQAQDNIFTPGDPILGVQRLVLDDTLVEVGNSIPGSNPGGWPAGEAPENMINRVGQKYLFFGDFNTGAIVTPLNNSPSVATSITLWIANDATHRDPASYQLLGSNDEITGFEVGGTFFDYSSFTLISECDLDLPGVLGEPRDQNADPPTGQPNGTAPLIAAFSQTVTFENTTAYNTYMILFPTIKDPVEQAIMQIAEVQLNYVAESVGVQGDANGDGNFDFGDIEAFFVALTDPAAYAAQYPDVSLTLLDMNADGGTDFGDIDAFFVALTGG